MARHGIPTASYATFSDEQLDEAHQYLLNHALPIVLKADGLAAGKGVLICFTLEEAQAGLNSILDDKKFGSAGSKVVIEQFLDGIEVSYFAALDGKNYVLLPEAKDYKRIGEGDTGLNTGGMGSISPVPFCNGDFHEKVIHRIVQPTVEGLKKEGIDYRGFLFFGLINVGGDPYVIEYNARMGDPETESVFPRLLSDSVEMMQAIHDQTLGDYTLEISDQCAATVFLVAGGYPEDYRKGDAIHIPNPPLGVSFFHAGTKEEQGRVVTNGGRVLAVSALGNSGEEALENAMVGAQQIQFEGKYFRADIGKDLISR
jgi:phosphoribosylamine--glycine ligase